MPTCCKPTCCKPGVRGASYQEPKRVQLYMYNRAVQLYDRTTDCTTVRVPDRGYDSYSPVAARMAAPDGQPVIIVR